MDKITLLKKYYTDTFGSGGIGNISIPSNKTFIDVLNYAIEMEANIIVKPKKGKNWYIKGFNKKKTFFEIQTHIEINQENMYKPQSELWLISYI